MFEELIGRHIIGHYKSAMCFEHAGKDNAMENDIILSDEDE